MSAADYVHEYTDSGGTRWWVVAEYRDGRYYGALTAEERKLTGCHTVFGPLSYVHGDGRSYKSRASALRRARQIYGAA